MNKANIMQKSDPSKTTEQTAKAAKHSKNSDKLFYMKFYPDHINELRDHLCRDLNLKTHAELPIYFRSPYAFPAAIDLKDALEKRYGIEKGSTVKKRLSKTLGRYLESSQYINAMCAIPKRYGLDMEPASEVQDNDREFYQAKLKERIKATMERRKRERESNQVVAAPTILAAVEAPNTQFKQNWSDE